MTEGGDDGRREGSEVQVSKLCSQTGTTVASARGADPEPQRAVETRRSVEDVLAGTAIEPLGVLSVRTG